MSSIMNPLEQNFETIQCLAEGVREACFAWNLSSLSLRCLITWIIHKLFRFIVWLEESLQGIDSIYGPLQF